MMMRRTRGGRGGSNNGGGHRRGGGGSSMSGNTANSGGVPNRHQMYDSNGPDVRIRGNVFQVFDKYQALARDAQSAGDRVKAENYLQHAEHYYRIILAIQEATGELYRARTPEGGEEGTDAAAVVVQDPAQMPQPGSDQGEPPGATESAVA